MEKLPSNIDRVVIPSEDDIKNFAGSNSCSVFQRELLDNLKAKDSSMEDSGRTFAEKNNEALFLINVRVVESDVKPDKNRLESYFLNAFDPKSGTIIEDCFFDLSKNFAKIEPFIGLYREQSDQLGLPFEDRKTESVARLESDITRKKISHYLSSIFNRGRQRLT